MLITTIKLKDKDMPVNLSFMRINESLLFALHQISGDSENDIMTHFYNMGLELFMDSVSRKRLPQRCYRRVKIFYKNTPILVSFTVWSSYFNIDSKLLLNDKKIDLYVEATFTSSYKRVLGDQMSDMLTEVGLGIGNTSVLSADKPSEQLYKCLRK